MKFFVAHKIIMNSDNIFITKSENQCFVLIDSVCYNILGDSMVTEGQMTETCLNKLRNRIDCIIKDITRFA